MLEIRDVTLSFGGVRALDSVTFAVADGDCLGLIGPNGAGKTGRRQPCSPRCAGRRSSARRGPSAGRSMPRSSGAD